MNVFIAKFYYEPLMCTPTPAVAAAEAGAARSVGATAGECPPEWDCPPCVGIGE